jgi:hypothetical protein
MRLKKNQEDFNKKRKKLITKATKKGRGFLSFFRRIEEQVSNSRF